MSAFQFMRQLPPSNIQLINQFLYMEKSTKEIVYWMKNAHLLSPYLWRLLVRDSKFVTVQLQQHQLYGFNLCYFFEAFIQRSQIDADSRIITYFEQFIMQILSYNPSLILNKYYVGNGGVPVYAMITKFLLSGRLNSFQYASEYLHDPFFRILQFSLKKIKSFKDYEIQSLLHSLQFYSNITTKMVETVLLVLEVSEKHLLSDDFKRQHEYGSFYIRNLFSGLFFQYFKQCPSYAQHYHDIDEYLRFRAQLQKTLWKIIKNIDSRFGKIILQYSDTIAKELIKVSHRFEFIQKLLSETKNFREVFFCEQFIFGIFRSRNLSLCKLLWSFEQQRMRISQMKRDGKTIMQQLGMSYGLTYNLIGMLWESGLFAMPFIQNKKSEKILKLKYGEQWSK